MTRNRSDMYLDMQQTKIQTHYTSKIQLYTISNPVWPISCSMSEFLDVVHGDVMVTCRGRHHENETDS